MDQTNHIAGKAVLIVAHGERGGNNDNARLLQLAGEVRRNLPGIQVEVGVLKGYPSIAEGWSRLRAEQKFVYPFFMSDGYFCSRILPRIIANAVGDEASSMTMLPPFGVSELLPNGVSCGLINAMKMLGLDGKCPTLLIAAHGASIDRQSSRRANELAASLMRTGLFRSVTCGFLDEAPHLRDMVADLEPDTLVLPHFNGLGSHSVDDMAKLAAKSPPHVHYLTPVGGQPWVGGIMSADIQKALNWADVAEAAE